MKLLRQLSYLVSLVLTNSAAHAVQVNDYFSFDFVSDFEYIDSQYESEDETLPFSRRYFQVGRLSLQPEVRSPEGDLRFKLDLRFDEEESNVRKAFLEFTGIPYSEFRFGKNTPHFRIERDTNVYDLPGVAFSKNQRVGVEYEFKISPIVLFVAASNGIKFDSNELTDHDPLPGWVDEELDKDDNDNTELGYGGGLNYKYSDDIKVKLIGYQYNQNFSDADIAYVDALPGGDSGDEKYDLIGSNLEFDYYDLEIKGQYIDAQAGAVNRAGWMARAAYKFDVDGFRYLNWVKLLISTSELTNDLEKDPLIFETWDRQRTTIGAIFKVHKWVRLLFEYNIEGEDTGGDDVDNDGFLTQVSVEL